MTTEKPNPILRETIEYALRAYSFVMEDRESFTLDELADRILQCYDTETNPTNIMVVNSLRHWGSSRIVVVSGGHLITWEPETDK